MISLELASRLRQAGLDWTPAPGDRFALPDRGIDEVFVLSNMTIQVYELPKGAVIGFNGTTEWALDDVEKDEAIWLPREDQLRDRLGQAFDRLERADGGYRVVMSGGGPAGAETLDGDILGAETLGGEAFGADTFVADTAEEAYGRALLHLLA